MDINSNITEEYNLERTKANQAWRDYVMWALTPEMENRGFTLSSHGSQTKVDTYFVTCVFENGDVYLDLTIDCKMGFSAKATWGLQQNWKYFPNKPMSMYDRENYTIRQLLSWLDEQQWTP